MTQHDAEVYSMGTPWMNSTCVRVYAKVWILWILMPEGPVGTKGVGLMITCLNQLMRTENHHVHANPKEDHHGQTRHKQNGSDHDHQSQKHCQNVKNDWRHWHQQE